MTLYILVKHTDNKMVYDLSPMSSLFSSIAIEI